MKKYDFCIDFLFLERERSEREREKCWFVVPPTLSGFHSSIVVGTGDRTHNLGVLG